MLERGHVERAALLEIQALRTYERLLGPEHPDLASPLTDLASAHVALGDHGTAEREARHALAIREHALGPGHPAMAEILRVLAHAVRRSGRDADALELAHRALRVGGVTTVDSKLQRPELGGAANGLVELGQLLARQGRYAQADDHLVLAETGLTTMFGPDHARVMPAVVARADSLMMQSRWREAAALYQRAIAVLEKSQACRDVLASAVAGLSRAQVELQHPGRALPALEPLWSANLELSPDVRVAVEFTLARALWSTGGDRRRAVALAAQALGEIRTIADARSVEVAEVERWIESHRYD